MAAGIALITLLSHRFAQISAQQETKERQLFSVSAYLCPSNASMLLLSETPTKPSAKNNHSRIKPLSFIILTDHRPMHLEGNTNNRLTSDKRCPSFHCRVGALPIL